MHFRKTDELVRNETDICLVMLCVMESCWRVCNIKVQESKTKAMKLYRK